MIDGGSNNSTPAMDDIASIVPGNSLPLGRTTVIRRQHDTSLLQNIPLTSPHSDPLCYALLFPYGTQGWYPAMTTRWEGCDRTVSIADFYRYHFMYRYCNQNLFKTGPLLYQFIVDMFWKIQMMRLHFIKTNQNARFANLHFTGDEIGDGAILLPSTFTGSPRYMDQAYLDDMAIVRAEGKPDIF